MKVFNHTNLSFDGVLTIHRQELPVSKIYHILHIHGGSEPTKRLRKWCVENYIAWTKTSEGQCSKDEIITDPNEGFEVGQEWWQIGVRGMDEFVWGPIKAKLDRGEIKPATFNAYRESMKFFTKYLWDDITDNWYNEKQERNTFELYSQEHFDLVIWRGQFTRLVNMPRAMDKSEKKVSVDEVTGEEIECTVYARAGNWINKEELLTLLNSVDRTNVKGRRDLTILCLLFVVGLRRTELARVRVGQVQSSKKRGANIVNLLCKGKKRMDVPIPALVVEAIEDYVTLSGKGRLGDDTYLIRGVDKRGNITPGDKPVSGEMIRLRVLALSEAAGLGHLTPHDGRRSLAQALEDGGAEISTIRSALRHSHERTTEVYMSRTSDGKRARKAYDGLGLELSEGMISR